MAKKEMKRRKRFERVLFVKMTNEMYERLREFAERHGLTVSAAIRLLVAEALTGKETGKEQQKRERE